MPIVPMTPPQAVPMFSGFDYVTVDTPRRRVYAAHSGSQALLVVDADTGKVVTQVKVGPLHGVAFDPKDGRAFTGDGDARTVSEVDPVAGNVLRSVDVPAPIDAIAFDPKSGRIYADEDDGTRVFVIDASTFKMIGTIDVPGHKPEYLAVDPVNGNVYQNIDDLGEVAVLDGATMKVARTFRTPDVGANHPLQYDSAYKAIVVGGTKGILETFDPAGKQLGKIEIQPRVDQCSLDEAVHVVACAGSGKLTFVKIAPDGTLSTIGSTDVAAGVHTVGVDAKAHRAWIVWHEPAGDFVQGFDYTP
jgi:hypothetical protein